ncbi:MAG: hypothetical protein COA41_06430 [Sphingopyxis sp.]|nr:MAG: hypothetical protein COA41_06430 [Sphingopyxis sp.]
MPGGRIRALGYPRLRCGRAVALASASRRFGDRNRGWFLTEAQPRQGRPAAAPYGAKAKGADAPARRLRLKTKTPAPGACG